MTGNKNLNWINIEIPDRKGLREFGLLMGGMIAGVFGLLLPWLFDFAWPQWPWLVAALLGFLALVIPRSLTYIYYVWMILALILGWINTRIILAVAFYLLITPIGLLMQLLGQNPLKPKAVTQDSYRLPTPVRSRDHMEHPF